MTRDRSPATWSHADLIRDSSAKPRLWPWPGGQRLALLLGPRTQRLIDIVPRREHLVVLRFLHAFQRQVLERRLLVVAAVFRRLPSAIRHRIARIARHRLHALGVLVDGVGQISIAEFCASTLAIGVIGDG